MNTVSIVIACFNGWKYMGKCLESLENQVIKPDEIIIVDDYSTDDTYEQLKKYKYNSKLNIKLLRNDKNSGPGYSREVGIKTSSSKYVAFCDCDDWFELNFIKDIKEKILSDRFDFCVFDNYVVSGNRKYIANITRDLKNLSKKEMIALYSMSLWRLVIRREILENIEYAHIYHAEDFVVAIQALNDSEKVTLIDKPYYNYFIRIDSVSTNPSRDTFYEFKVAYDILKDKICSKYREECEFLGIKTLCYGATLNAFKTGISINEIKSLVNEFNENYPNWYKNKYMHTEGKIKNIYYYFIDHELYGLAKVMAFFHGIAVKFQSK